MNSRATPEGKPVEKVLENSALLHRLLRIVMNETSLERQLQQALDELLKVSWLSLLPKGGVFLVEEPDKSLRLVVEKNLGPQIIAMCAQVRSGHCLCGRAAQTATVQHASSVDHRHENCFDGMEAHGHYNVPIIADGNVIGVLVLYLSDGHKRDEVEIEFLVSFSEILALLITAKDREHSVGVAQEKLREAHSETNSLMATIREHTLFSQTDRDGMITDVNDAFCQASGYSREELLATKHNLLKSGIHPPEFWKSFWSTILAGQAWRGEICDRRKDGNLFWVDTIVMPICGLYGSIERFLSIRFDITERKQTEAKLSRIGRILDDSSNELYVMDAETLKYTLVNRGARENLGYSADEVCDMTPVDIIPEFARDKLVAKIGPLVRREIDKLTFETVHQRKDGSVYPAEVNLQYAAGEQPPIFVAIVQDITERKANDAHIHQIAFYDSLTGLANRPLTLDRLRQTLARGERASINVWLLFLDLDRFKEINDTCGHAVGDKVLIEIAHRFQSILRKSETLARIGGDEFVIIIENVSDAQVVDLIERLNSCLSSPVIVEGKTHNLAASIGVAQYPKDSSLSEELLQLADIAMYEAKSTATHYRFYDASMKSAIARSRDIAERLALALTEDRLALHYQPFIDLETGQLLGAEALLRWNDPDWGNVGPFEFIPVAEKRGMMSDIGEWVIGRACRQLKQWQDAGYNRLGHLAVNVAASQLETDTILHHIDSSMERHETPQGALQIEITESSMMADPGRAAEILRNIKDRGLSIAIDDFGTGYSSLAYLKGFATDKLKIDMSFVRDLLEDSNTHAIVSATIAMAHNLGLVVLAEGVETQEQAVRLHELNCDQAQGYLFGRAIPSDEFATTWLKKSPM
ncbi:MAG: hypothetical protein VR78_09750 [Hoeflea sp. BRH_c9]|nr:MAG: hypothetical protein VR78_09750 [Hoeflea sp. BRH_c9]